MTAVTGHYFFPGSARSSGATASVDAARMFIVSDAAGVALTQAPMRQVRVSARLGTLRRRFEMPDGGRFETADNDGADALLRSAGRLRPSGWIDRIERSLKWVAASVAVAVLTIYLFIAFGIPAAALWLADETPPWVTTLVSNQTLTAMDRLMLDTSRLRPAQKQKAQRLFDRMAAQGKAGKKGYRLLFRDGRNIGPNAFSLPDGTVVMTDQLYPLVQRDDELEGVFGHEIAHADRRHALQALYQASIVPAAIALMSGDVTQVGQMAAILPGILVQSAYSRALEQQADDDSAVMMRRIGADPAALGELLQRMEKKVCGPHGCSGPSWLGDHPDTEARVSKLRSERLIKPPAQPQPDRH